MIKVRSPQIRISFQHAADKTALLAFALGLVLSLAVPGAGAKDREDEGKHDRGQHHELLKCDDTMKDEFRPDSLLGVPGLVDAPENQPPFGIFGHALEDLILEGISHEGAGTYRIDVGS